MGSLHAELNLTPEKPLQRAYQRYPQALAARYLPGPGFPCKREKAEIYFWDESGFRANALHGKTWAERGKTPVVSRPGQRRPDPPR